MTRMLVWLTLAGLWVLLFLLAGCGGNSTAPATMTSQIIPETTGLTLKAGQQQQLQCSVKNNGVAVANPNLSWTVSGNIGSISPSGLFTATSTVSSDMPETGKITITGYGQTATINVTVTVGDLAQLAIIVPTGVDLTNVSVGTTIAFSAVGYDNCGNKGKTRIAVTPQWSVDDGIGAITSAGAFSASTLGNGNVTATAGGLTASVAVTVVASSGGGGGSGSGKQISQLDINYPDSFNPATMLVGDKVVLSARVTYTDGTEATVIANWAISPNLGTLAADGQNEDFTAGAVGSCVITASYIVSSSSKFSNTLNITVAPSPATLDISYPSSDNLQKILLGDSVQFAAYVTDTAGTRGKTRTLASTATWQVTGNIGAITTNGLFTAAKIGSGSVTASYQFLLHTTPSTLTASVNITVVPTFQGTIAFIKQDAYTNIYTLTGDGTITPLDNGNNHFGYPNWSPNGQQLVFTSSGTPLTGICTMNADGSNPQQFLAAQGEDPAWSPNGTILAYSNGQFASGEIDLANAQGVITKLATGAIGNPRSPAWSPDGSKLAFCLNDVSGLTNGLYVVNSDGSQQAVCIYQGTVQHVSWAPNTSQITFSDNANIYTIAPSGGAAQTIAQQKNQLIGGFAMAPDGSAVVYGVQENGMVQLVLQNLATQHTYQLTNYPSAYALNPTWKP